MESQKDIEITKTELKEHDNSNFKTNNEAPKHHEKGAIPRGAVTAVTRVTAAEFLGGENVSDTKLEVPIVETCDKCGDEQVNADPYLARIHREHCQGQETG